MNNTFNPQHVNVRSVNAPNVTLEQQHESKLACCLINALVIAIVVAGAVVAYCFFTGII